MRDDLTYCQFLCPATYNYYDVLHEQSFVNGEFHLGPGILQEQRSLRRKLANCGLLSNSGYWSKSVPLLRSNRSQRAAQVPGVAARFRHWTAQAVGDAYSTPLVLESLLQDTTAGGAGATGADE